MKSRNYLGSFLVFRVILVIYVTDNRSRSLLGMLCGNISQIEYLDLYTISIHVLHLLILRSRGSGFRSRT